MHEPAARTGASRDRTAPAAHSLPHVVIVGGGFAGLSAAKALRRAPVRVTLLDRTNHYLFQPLLYQVAAGVLSPADVAMPTRFLLRRHPRATVLLAHIDRIEPRRRLVLADRGQLEISYDYLIVAPGARHSYFGHPEWEAIAPGLKTLDDAREIRRRFLLALEEAEKSSDPAEQEALLTFVIIGGGPTGVELAGILPTIARRGFRGDFRRIDPGRVRVILLEGGKRLLPAFPAQLANRACRDLENLGVQCRTGAMVTRVTGDGVYVGEERIRARTVFWAAGNAASPLVRSLAVPTDRQGRVLVQPDLSVPGYPEIFVAGDAAAVPLGRRQDQDNRSQSTPAWVPGLAAAANQMGTHAGRIIAVSVEGRRRRTAFRYRDKGSLAVIGRGRAIADFGALKLTGAMAFVTWLFVHLLYLAGFRNRVSVMLEWAYAYFTYRPGARVVTWADVEAARRQRASAERARERMPV